MFEKTIPFFVFFLLTFFVESAMADVETEKNDCFVHVKLDEEEDPPGTMEFSTIEQGCDGVGLNCDIVPCDEYDEEALVSQGPSGGYIVEAHLQNVEVKVKDSTGTWTNFMRDGNNYHFTSHHCIIIDYCPAYPELENIKVNLEGILTDSNGKFEVYIPSGTY